MIFVVNLKNIGMNALVGSGNNVQVKVYDDFARTVPTAIEDLSTGTTVYSGEIDYDKTGNKTLYLDVNIIDSDKNIVEESTYLGNQGGITFTSYEAL